MKILIVADPMERLKPKADTTLCLLREGLRRKHEIYWCLGEDVYYDGDHVAVSAMKVTACPADALGELGARALSRLDAFGAVVIRKEPPFDAHYVKLCWLLALEETKIPMFNRPSLLLRYHEKLGALEALHQGFLKRDDVTPTFIGDTAGATGFVKTHHIEKGVVKPFLGFGGHDIELFDRLPLPPGEDKVVQPFVEEVHTRGDRRVIYLNGEMLASFARMPPKGKFVSNLAQGGVAEAMELLPRERESCERLGKFLSSVGIFFAGADLIGHYVSEVNITSPTGLRSLEKLEGNDYASPIWDALEAKPFA